MQQSIQLNIIPFFPSTTEVTIPFYKEYKEGYSYGFIETDLKGLLDDKMTKLEQAEQLKLFTDFAEPKENAIMLTINLEEHKNFALHYYRYLIYLILRHFTST
jgi:hypothetical protein